MQAVEAVLRARAAGERRLTLELMLPQEGMSSQQTGWPGGIRQQAKVMIPAMVEPLLVRLNKQEGLQVRLSRVLTQIMRLGDILEWGSVFCSHLPAGYSHDLSLGQAAASACKQAGLPLGAHV